MKKLGLFFALVLVLSLNIACDRRDRTLGDDIQRQSDEIGHEMDEMGDDMRDASEEVVD
jgi:hypothetical protein